jgi:hypothetical protein
MPKRTNFVRESAVINVRVGRTRRRIVADAAELLDMGMSEIIRDLIDREFRNYLATRGVRLYDGRPEFIP